VLQRVYASSSSDAQVLAEVIRTEHRACQEAGRAAVEHAMVAGDALIAAQKHLPKGGWLSFLKSCGIPRRTANDYVALATARAQIEADGQRAAHASIRAALRSIGRSAGGTRKKNPPKLRPESWAAASRAERLQFVLAVGIDELLSVLPNARPERDVRPLGGSNFAKIFDLIAALDRRAQPRRRAWRAAA
jgi:hypothetical protein